MSRQLFIFQTLHCRLQTRKVYKPMRFDDPDTFLTWAHTEEVLPERSWLEMAAERHFEPYWDLRTRKTSGEVSLKDKWSLLDEELTFNNEFLDAFGFSFDDFDAFLDYLKEDNPEEVTLALELRP